MKRPFLQAAKAIDALKIDPRETFRDGPPYVLSATALSLMAARQYARGGKGRPPLRFRSQVQWEDYVGRALDAGREAAATWRPRDRRAGYEAFRKHVFKSVDAKIRQRTIPQGIATGGEDGIWEFSPDGGPATFSLRVDGKGNPFAPRVTNRDVLDIKQFVGVAPDGVADTETREAFTKRYGHRLPDGTWVCRDLNLATAVAPYTANTPARYAQQLRKKPKWDDAARLELEQEIVRAANLLHTFTDMWRPVSRMLDFAGLSPVPVHRVLRGLQGMPPPTAPPLGPELIGPFMPSAPTPGLSGVLYRVGEKEDGMLQPQARAYLLKVATWYSALSEAIRELEQERGASEALAQYARRNTLKRKRSTRKP